MQDSNHIINEVTSGDYKYGFVTDIDTEVIHRGLDEETVRIISAKKNEPEWMLEWRLAAYERWLSADNQRPEGQLRTLEACRAEA